MRTTGSLMLSGEDGRPYRKDIHVKFPTEKDPTVRYLVWVDAQPFDRVWKRTDPHYLSDTSRDMKYDTLADSMAKPSARTWPLEVSSVVVDKNGRVGFTDGRHRMAYLRNTGITPIPVGMDADSIRHAKSHGYLVSAPSLAESLIQEIGFSLQRSMRRTPLPIRWVMNNKNYKEARFSLRNVDGRVLFYHKPPSTLWFVDFETRIDGGEWSSDDVPRGLSLPEVFTLFSTVTHVMQSFIHDEQPSGIRFDACGNLRQQMYDQWSQQLANSTDPVLRAYKATVDGDVGMDGSVVFTLKRKRTAK